jgi:AcrR family transcriptional regulator
VPADGRGPFVVAARRRSVVSLVGGSGRGRRGRSACRFGADDPAGGERALANENGRPRKYDSPVRRRQVEETRERIIRSGADLLHGFPVWNWSALTVDAVAERAGISKRTVYRYFASERSLRDAVMVELQREADISIEGLRLEDIADVTRRRMRFTAQFPLIPRTPRDPTVAAVNERQRTALVDAVRAAAPDWGDDDCEQAAAMLDVVWGVVGYERLLADWEFDGERAIAALTWVVGLIEQAIRDGARPGDAAP